MSDEMYTCPCCGYKTFHTPPPGAFEICPICFWEDDDIQRDDPDYAGGANHPSLRQAQSNFKEFGASKIEMQKYVRKPTPEDEKDPHWKPY